jgi:hypothetical protein
MINLSILTLLLLISTCVPASELEDAITYGNLLTQAVKEKEEVKLKKLSEYKAIKRYLTENKCSGFKYKAYIVGPKNKQFLYLVASKGKNVIIGRHFKAPINGGTVDVSGFESSTKGCLNLGTPPSNVAALTATHLKHYPNEFHVLQSRLAGLPLYIGTSEGIYSVEGGNIRLVEAETVNPTV